ncbi:MAG: alpha/beta hydrolase [Clostridia bacterium]|nr:alpha/beta hydrolase [Clostridia bacterium]
MILQTLPLYPERHTALTCYLQEVDGGYRQLHRRPGILVIPGGGYQYCSLRESDPVVSVFLSAGYQVFLLHYSVAEHAAWPNPLLDYDRAMETIDAHRDEWHLLPGRLAVIGFSAGGHLAAAGATLGTHRPDAVILGYALLGKDIARYADGPSLIEHVTADTPPCFLFAARTDHSVPVDNTLQFVRALEDHGVVYECHIYSHGPHGFSTGDTSVQDASVMPRSAYHWTEDALSFLTDVMGGMNNGVPTPPART